MSCEGRCGFNVFITVWGPRTGIIVHLSDPIDEQASVDVVSLLSALVVHFFEYMKAQANK